MEVISLEVLFFLCHDKMGLRIIDIVDGEAFPAFPNKMQLRKNVSTQGISSFGYLDGFDNDSYWYNHFGEFPNIGDIFVWRDFESSGSIRITNVSERIIAPGMDISKRVKITIQGSFYWGSESSEITLGYVRSINPEKTYIAIGSCHAGEGHSNGTYTVYNDGGTGPNSMFLVGDYVSFISSFDSSTGTTEIFDVIPKESTEHGYPQYEIAMNLSPPLPTGSVIYKSA